MDALQVKAIFSGLMFGMWPLFINRSGLEGNVAMATLGIGSMVVVIPIIMFSLGKALDYTWLIILAAIIVCFIGFYFYILKDVDLNWYMAMGGVLTSLFGMLVFNDLLAKAPVTQVGTLFVFMIVVQIMVPAVYQSIMDGLVATKIFGFIFAIAAAVLLLI